MQPQDELNFFFYLYCLGLLGKNWFVRTAYSDKRSKWKNLFVMKILMRENGVLRPDRRRRMQNKNASAWRACLRQRLAFAGLNGTSWKEKLAEWGCGRDWQLVSVKDWNMVCKGRVRRLGLRVWGVWDRELTTFAAAGTGHRLEWTRILKCLSLQYFAVWMVYVTRLYDYGSRNLDRNMQSSDSVGVWITFNYADIFICLKIYFSLTSLQYVQHLLLKSKT